MKELTFSIGNRVSGYLTDGLPFLGYISAFKGEEKKTKRPLIMVRICGSKPAKYEIAYLDSCHPMPLNEITHTKETFLAAASRCSPILAFKSHKARRDYLEGLWVELVNFSQNKD